MNGRWRGPLLRDVLLKAGVAIEGEANVAFASLTTEVQDDFYYGGSIDLARVMNPELSVILCLEVFQPPDPLSTTKKADPISS